MEEEGDIDQVWSPPENDTLLPEWDDAAGCLAVDAGPCGAVLKEIRKEL